MPSLPVSFSLSSNTLSLSHSPIHPNLTSPHPPNTSSLWPVPSSDPLALSLQLSRHTLSPTLHSPPIPPIFSLVLTSALAILPCCVIGPQGPLRPRLPSCLDLVSAHTHTHTHSQLTNEPLNRPPFESANTPKFDCFCSLSACTSLVVLVVIPMSTPSVLCSRPTRPPGPCHTR